MPTIPRNESASLLAQPMRLVRGQPGLGLAQGFATIAENAQIVNDTLDQRDKARDIAFTAQRSATDQLALHQHLLDLQDAAPPDGAGVSDAFQQALAQSALAADKAAPSDRAREMLAQNYAQLRVNMGVQAQTFEATRRAQFTVDQLNQSVGTEAAIVASDPSQFDAAVARVDQNALAIARNWNPAAISEWRKKGLEDLATAKIQADIMRNPLAALADITAHKYDAYFVGNPLKLTALINGSLNEYTQLQNQQYTQQQRAKTQDEENAAKAGLAVLDAGGNIGAFVAQNADRLSPEYIKYFDTRARTGPVASNPRVFSDLLIAASDRDVSAQAQAALFGLQLTPQDFSKVLSVTRGASVPSTYKQGVDYIKTLVGPTFGVADASGKADRMAQALLDWDKWTEVHPQATDTESISRFVELGNQYRMMDQIQTEFSYGLPRFYVGSRAEMSKGKLQQAYNSAQQAFQAGAISQSELDDEMAKIDQWLQLENSKSVEPPKPTGPTSKK